MLIDTHSRYLVVPINISAPKSKLRLMSTDKLLLDLDARVDFASAASVMYYDLAPFYGIDLTVSHESGKSFGFSEKKPDFPIDPVRPELHFTANQGWINDPDGLIFYEGSYQLFFQHNPVGIDWGNMHWGHAVSSDLVHWRQLDDILYPDETGDMYSGSAVIDSDNLLGLKENEHDPLILFYTAAGGNREISSGKPFTQCIAYSTDGAKTFRKYAKNPVVSHIKGYNRDPKVVRDPESGCYIMALFLDGDDYALLTSRNLADWQLLQTLSLHGDRECPDFYPLKAENGSRKWVMTGANDCYMLGDFDLTNGFHNLTEPHKFGFGCVYAAQTFNLPDESRRLRLSWNRFLSVPSRNFNCELSVPCELTLRDGGLRIAPARELDRLFVSREVSEKLPSHGQKRSITLPCSITLRLSKLEEAVTVNLCGNSLTVGTDGLVTVGDKSMPIGGSFGIRIIADSYGIELFDTDGLSFGSFAAEMHGNVLTIGGEGSLDRLEIAELQN